MGDVSLEQVLARVPDGLPVAVGCWLVARAADALASAPRAVTPREVRVADDGAVTLAPPRPGAAPFAYLAPEVVRGQDPDARSAVFGLGALLVETLTGRSPFVRESDMETRIAVAEDTVPALSGRVPEASRELDAIVQRALAKRASDRFASMDELAARIDAFLADELHDVGRERLAAVVQAAVSGASTKDALFAHGFAPPPPGAPLGEPKLQVPPDAPIKRGFTPAPGSVQPARARPTPPPGIIEPARARPTPAPGSVQPARARPTPPPGIIEPARARPTPSPGSVQPARARATPSPGSVQPVRPTPPPGTVEPARARPTPGPGALRPAARSAPPTKVPSYEDAELDLSAGADRLSDPTKPKLDMGADRLGGPLELEDVGGARRERARTQRRPGSIDLALDEDALHKERNRPATVAPEEELGPPAPSWIPRIIGIAVALLAAALAYQFVLRPLLK